jgi:sigma-E factor negative regulatory protein RseA
MKSKISAMMDGELEAQDLGEPLSAIGADREARESWRTYHLISDALRGEPLLTHGCARRVSQRLAQEPTLVAPLPGPVAAPQSARWFVPSALAASLAAVTFVGWLALTPQRAPVLAVAPVAQSQPPTQVVRVAEPPRVPLTRATQDYIRAHQTYSPRNSLQGVAPYVRSVSDETEQRKK